MDKEEFKKELDEIKVSSANWKEKMMMVTRLYKAFGYELKDINEKSEIMHVFLPISGLLDNMMEPSDESFFKYILTKDEALNIDSVNQHLYDERIERIFSNDRSLIKHDYDINSEVGREAFFEEEYVNIRLSMMKKLMQTPNMSKQLIDFIVAKHGKSYLVDFKSRLGGGYDAIASDLYDYVMEAADGKERMANACMSALKDSEKRKSQDIKKGLIKRITTILNFFDEAGYLEEICKVNNSMMNELGVPTMMLSMGEGKGCFNVNNLLDENYFNQFDNEELFVFSSFYTNRLEKIIEDVNEGIFLHYKLGTFYDSVAYGEIPSNIDSADARTILRQRSFLEKTNREAFKEFKSDAEFFDIGKVPDEIMTKYKDAYESYFDKYTFGMENDFEKDYIFVFCNRGIEACMYVLKDFSMESLIYTLSQYKSKINFGLIKEDRLTVNDLGEEQVLIGIDCKDLQTIRLHYPKEAFDKFVACFFPDGDFPDYIGNDDFSFTRKNGEKDEIKTYMLYKFTKEERKAIKKLMEELKEKDPASDLYKFIRHMYENMHPSQNPKNTKKKNRRVNKNDGEIE